MLESIKKQVYQANKKLVTENLVILTWGNASAYDPESGFVVIKPSGVSYDTMTEEDMVIVDLEGNIIEGQFKPSSDTPTHLEIYKIWGEKIRGVVHTHSSYATAWAQSGEDIPIQGTTHADYFYGDIPCLGVLTEVEVEKAYEYFTGVKIVTEFKRKNINPTEMGGCLLTGHGPFTWGGNIDKAVENSIVLEAIAHMAFFTLQLNKKIKLPNHIKDKHYFRKHGKNAYYGQR